MSRQVTIDCRHSAQDVADALEMFFWKSADDFSLWLGARFSERIHPFERTILNAELEVLTEFAKKREDRGRNGPQLALL